MVSALAQRDRLTHLRLELTHIPLRVGAESLVPVRELFRPYVRNVAFLLDPFQVSDQVFALDHVVLGADLNRDTRRADEEIFQALLAFRRRAGRRSTYALGLSSRLQVAHAITAGMAEISGSGVLGEIKKLPDQVAVIRRQDLALS